MPVVGFCPVSVRYRLHEDANIVVPVPYPGPRQKSDFLNPPVTICLSVSAIMCLRIEADNTLNHNNNTFQNTAPYIDWQEGDPVPRNTIFNGDALEALSKFPDNSIQTVVTSPPYWSVRDYGYNTQIGLEESLPEYLDKLCSVFAEVHRVLANDGVLWLNIADGYTSGNRKTRAPDRKNPARAMSTRPRTPDGLKKKDLIGLPWRLAFRLQEAGWYLRNDIIWEKPNAMPESVKDRPTRSHEYIFMLTKSARYFYDREAVLEENGRNRRTVWSVNTKAFRGAHFATFPSDLVLPCILSTSRPGDTVLDPFLGSGTTGEVAIKNGRSFLGIELNSAYVEMAEQRLLSATGLRPHLAKITRDSGLSL